MPDNQTIDNGDLSDFIVSADEAAGGAKLQRVKLAYSADGSEVHVPADADGLLVNLGANNDVTVASLPLPSGASTLGEQQTQTTALGSLTETAPGTDTASSGLNGRLQRIAQRLTSLIALLPSSIGQKASSGSLSVVLSSDHGAVNIGDVDILSVVPGTGDTNLGKAEDAAHVSGATGVMMLTVRKDTAAALAGADADYQPPLTDANGQLYVNPGALAPSADGVYLGPNTAGGSSIFRSLDIDETEEEVKATAGVLHWCHFVNRTTSVRYLKFYNATAASTTVGTTTPVMTLELPANASDHTAGTITFGPYGLAFSTAITVACTTGLADSDSTAPGTNDVVINIGYI